MLNPSWDELRRYAEKAADILPLAPIRIRLAYRLFYLPFEEGAKLLALAAQAGSELLAADFKPAERNLELPAAFLAHSLARFLTFGASGPVFANFLARGGLEGLASRAGLAVLERQRLLGGAAVLLRLSSASRNSSASI